MLIWLRNSAYGGAMKFLLMGLLILAVAGLVMMDVGGFFRGTMSTNTVVEGGGVEIGTMELDRTIRRVLAAQGIPPQEAYALGLIDTIVNSEIQSRLFAKEARKMGLVVGDNAVMDQVARLAAPLAAEGRSKREALQQILRQQNISEGEFIQSLRQEMGSGLLRASVQPPPVFASPLLARALYRYDNETRSVRAIVLQNNAMEDIAAPTDDQLQSYYEANRMDFLIPESRTVTIATLKPDMIREKVDIPEDRLRAEYDRNIIAFTKPQRRKVEQAVFPDESAAKGALEKVQSGGKLEGSNTQDLEQTGLLAEIAGPVFAAKEGEAVGPIETPLGWHVLIVRGILPEEVQSFDSVREKLRKELSSMALTEEMYNTGNTIEDRIAAGESFADLVKEYGLTTEIIGPFRMNGNNADGKDLFKSYAEDKAKIIQTAFDYEEGDVAPIVETADGYFHIMRIDQVVPDTYKPFDSVKSALKQRWMDEQRALAARAKAQTLLQSLNEGTALEEVAKQNGLSVRSISGIGRKSEAPAPLTSVAAARIFSAKMGEGFSAETESGFVVGVVDDIKLPAAPSLDDKNVKDLADLAARSLPQEILALYVQNLGAGKEIRINRPLLEQLYAPNEER